MRSLLEAVGLVALIVLAEYVARHFLLFWFPVVGALRVNDMLAMALVYAGLVWFTLPADRRTLALLPVAARMILAEARTWQVWVAALTALGLAVALAPVDAWLWGSVELPRVSSPWRWEMTLLASAAPLLTASSLLLANGLIVPIAEEWLWRGLIQPRFIVGLGVVAGLIVTAVVFSAKHAIIDASLGRFLSLTAFGLVMGLLALRRGWPASALAHVAANTAATTLALAAGAAEF